MAAPSTAFVRQYQDSIYLLAQQMDTRLRGTVLVDTNFRGEVKLYDQYNTDDMIEIMSEYADTPVQTPNHQRRAVFPRYFVSNTLEDPIDALQMLVDPKSAYMQAKMAAANRKTDDIIVAAFGSTAYIGKNGTTTQTFTAANQIASGSAGLTKAKMIQAKKLLDAAEVDVNDRFLAYGSSQLYDLLMSTEVTNSDYNVVKTLVQGEVKTWLGFEFVRTERLLTNGSSERLCYAYQRWAMQLAVQKEITGRVDERSDKNYAWQVYMKMCMGATRLEEARIVEIACTETV